MSSPIRIAGLFAGIGGIELGFHRALGAATHRQPGDTQRVVQKVKEIPRRSASSEVGFDGVGITVINFRNDGGQVQIVDKQPAPQPGDSFHYGSMIVRMANEYERPSKESDRLALRTFARHIVGRVTKSESWASSPAVRTSMRGNRCRDTLPVRLL